MELLRALGALVESPGPELAGIAEMLELGPLPAKAAHADLFLFQLYPYASVYLGDEGMMGGEARDRIAGFWRALGWTPPPEPDHLAVMLGLYARLGELEGAATAADDADGVVRERWRHVRAAFLWEHLVSWLPIFLAKLAALAEPAPGSAGVVDAFYLRWGALLRAALVEEAKSLPPPALLPLHLRLAPEVVDPRRSQGGQSPQPLQALEPIRPLEPQMPAPQAFLASLLSPVRSGIILVRADLARASRELGIGPRVGERRAVLETMLDQDAAATLGWLEQEAVVWAGRHVPELHLAAPLAHFWRSRAETAASLLARLRAEL